jgi:ribose 5-phosphate isomerase B
MNISIGSDHAGYELKLKLKEYLQNINRQFDRIMINDRGTYSNESCNYADYAHLVASDVVNKKSKFGILICGSGNGINMTANKWNDIRAALCWKSEIAEMARLHNDSNILTLPGRYISVEEAIECVNIFINTQFEGGRHKNRVNSINLSKND